MWTDLLIDNKAIKGVYGDKEPSLKEIRIMKVEINHSIELSITVEWDEMPDPLPKRWAQNGAKSCCAIFSFYNIDQVKSIFKHIDLNLMKEGTLEMHIEMASNKKKCVVVCLQDGKCVMDIEADITSCRIGYNS